jgi:hypothetical protein
MRVGHQILGFIFGSFFEHFESFSGCLTHFHAQFNNTHCFMSDISQYIPTNMYMKQCFTCGEGLQCF